MDIMIDLETLGKTPDAVVLSIGACAFDLFKGVIEPIRFHAVLNIEDQIRAGRTVDGDTLTWWMNQTDEARKLFNETRQNLDQTIWEFMSWINLLDDDVYVWGNGSTFDISILENLMNHKVPWKYSNVMDLRTFRRFVAGNAKIPRDQGTHHNALDDAINQAKFVIQHYKGSQK